MRAGAVRGEAPGTAIRAAARGFAEHLARARREGRVDPARASGAGREERALRGRERPAGEDEASPPRRPEAARVDPAGDRRPEAQGAVLAPRHGGGAPRTLAAAVERLALALERAEAGGRPALEMCFGTSLRVRLVQGERGLEVGLAGERAMARLARAEMPRLVRALAGRGIRVARAEVSELPAARGRVDGEGALR